VPEVYIGWIIRFVLFCWELWYLFASFTRGLGGILVTEDILYLLDLLDHRSFISWIFMHSLSKVEELQCSHARIVE